ncbi:MAG: asparagine synthase-related protein [Bryobacteraceae bacterium]
MLHERFYTAGIWADESAGVYVGWIARRDSFCDRMPLRNERGDVVLAYSGEDFPEPGTAQFLKERGHELDVAGPSYIVHLYEESPSFPARLNGRFHGLLIDQNRKSAVLFNDRFGMHRLCYHEANDGFYFAGEAKAILAVRPELRSIDSTGLAEFVSCGAVLENRTIFEKIHALPPASAWVFQNGSLQRKSSYFHPSEWEGQETLDRESYYNELRETFTRNLPRYFTGQERMGMSLTGGLDTRMILAARNAAPGSLPCYTFGSMFRKNQDVRVASRVAEACKQPHEVITAGHEFLSHFKHYAERAVYLTDGCVDVGRAPDLYLNERAREVAPVRMTGNYGGEILRGVRAFKPVKPATGLFVPEFSSHLRQAAETYAETTLVHPVSFSAFRQAPWYHHGVLALEQTQLSVRSPYLDNDFVQTVFRSPRWALAKNDVSLRLIADASPALLRIPTDRGLAGDRSRVTTAIHRGFLEFLFKAEYACDMGMPQWLARLDHIVSPFRLEQLFLGRHKVFHFRAWYRDTLGPYLQETLLDRRSLSRSFLQRTRVETVVRRHLKGHRNYTNEIHKLLTLEMIHRLFIDGRERSGFEEQPKTHTQPIRVSVPS